MRLGDLFSNEDRRDYVRGNFRVGTVFYLHSEDTYDEKDKYYLLVDTSDPPLLLIINKKIHRIYEKRPHLKACQIKVTVAEYPKIFTRDCWIDCTTVWSSFSQRDIEEQVMNDMSRLRGMLGMESLNQVTEALENDERIPQEDKERILEAV